MHSISTYIVDSTYSLETLTAFVLSSLLNVKALTSKSQICSMRYFVFVTVNELGKFDIFFSWIAGFSQSSSVRYLTSKSSPVHFC